ncbi:MAG: hypothetical protein GY861_24770, partial [bacterium]|nr:hypothetical protein [bacterium]
QNENNGNINDGSQLVIKGCGNRPYQLWYFKSLSGVNGNPTGNTTCNLRPKPQPKPQPQPTLNLGSGNVIPEWIMVKNNGNNQCLTYNNRDYFLSTCNPSNAYQKFNFKKVGGNKHFTLVQQTGNKVMDVYGNRTGDNTNVRPWGNNNTTAQKWYLKITQGCNSFNIKGVRSNKCLSPRSFSQSSVVLFGCIGHKNQEFSFLDQSGKEVDNYEFNDYSITTVGGFAEYYNIVSKATGQCLRANRGNGQVLRTYKCNPGNYKNEMWRIAGTGEANYYYLRRMDNRNIDVARNRSHDNNKIWSWGFNRTNAQRFRIEKVGDAYRFVHKSSNKCATKQNENNGNINDGSQLVIKGCGNRPYQLWYFKSLSGVNGNPTGNTTCNL